MSYAYGYITRIIEKVNAGNSSNRCEVYYADAKLPGSERHVPAFFKIYPPESRNKGHFNELFGWSLGKSCGLPVAESAVLCVCDKGKLVGPSRYLQSKFANEKVIPGIASTDCNVHKVKQLIHSGEQLIDDLLNWKYVAQVAAFDELLYNTDRNAFNLIRDGASSYSIIDHEKIFGGTNWTLEGLSKILSQITPANHLAEMIVQTSDELKKRRMINVANTYLEQMNYDLHFLGSVEEVCKLPPGTVQTILELLNNRLPTLPENLYNYIHVEQMFNAGS